MGSRIHIKSFDVLLISFLLIFHITNNCIVLAHDTMPFRAHVADTYLDAVDFMLVLRGSSLPEIVTSFYRDAHQLHTPLYRAVISILFTIFGVSQDVATFSNSLFFSGTIICTYLLGKELFDRQTGLVAAILLSFYPAAVSLSKAFHHDSALMFFIVLSLIFLLKSDAFRHLNWSLLFGISMGLTALTKTTWFFFLLGPVAATLGPALISGGEQRNSLVHRIFNTIMSASISVLLFCPWYIINGAAYLQDIRRFTDFGTALDLPGCLFMVLRYLGTSLTIPGGILFAAGMFFLLRVVKKYRFYFLSLMLIPFMIYAVVITTADLSQYLRYLAPLLPAIAIISSLPLVSIDVVRTKERVLRMVSLSLVLVGLVYILLVSHFFRGDIISPMSFQPSCRWPLTLGRLAPCTQPHDFSALAESLLDRSNNLTLFLTNWDGRVSSPLVYELKVGSALRPENSLVIRQCVEFDRPSWWLSLDECIEQYEDSDYVLIEPLRKTSWFLIQNETFSDVLLPLESHIRQDIADSEVLEKLSTNKPEDGQEYAFGWLNDTAILIER